MLGYDTINNNCLLLFRFFSCLTQPTNINRPSSSGNNDYRVIYFLVYCDNMEYIFIGIYTFISVLTGIIVSIIWLITARKAYLRKWFLGLIYIFCSIGFSSLIIQIIGVFFWILYSDNHRLNINNYLQTLYITINVWGLTSGVTTLMVFIIGLICIIVHRLIKFFEENFL